jgi:hypothetical protein
MVGGAEPKGEAADHSVPFPANVTAFMFFRFDNAWCVVFDDGFVGGCNKTGNRYVRAVRTGS